MKDVVIGIRREDKSQWERRVPLIPSDLKALRDHGLRFVVQPSGKRAYADDMYREAGIEVSRDLTAASLILGVKEIAPRLLEPGKTYVCFPHVIKGQRHNMPMLRQLLALGCSLVDYEKIVDENGQRLVFFGRHAGYAGMIETLWCLGRRLQAEGVATPLADLRHAFEYAGLEEARAHLDRIGERLLRHGLDASVRPLVFGISGYGNVSQGAQEILGRLPVRSVSVGDLPSASARGGEGGPLLVKVVFEEEHLARPIDSGSRFDLQEYYQHPERYRGRFAEHLPHLDVLVNAIYWEERYPRLVTKAWARRSFKDGGRPRLRVIGDISCDIEGSVELTVRHTQPGSPCYVYEPISDQFQDGYEGDGLVIMAVDNLPAELPREASRHFSTALRDVIPLLAAADWQVPFDELDLPPQLKQAVIVHQGELTPSYRYLSAHLEAYGGQVV